MAVRDPASRTCVGGILELSNERIAVPECQIPKPQSGIVISNLSPENYTRASKRKSNDNGGNIML